MTQRGMTQSTRVTSASVKQTLSKRKYMRVIDFLCANVGQEIEVAKFITNLVLKKEVFIFRKVGCYPIYATKNITPPKTFMWHKYPVGFGLVKQ